VWTQMLAKGKQFLSLKRHRHVTHIVKTCWTLLYTQTNTNNINKTWTLLQSYKQLTVKTNRTSFKLVLKDHTSPLSERIELLFSKTFG
jgi:hypothetical protein